MLFAPENDTLGAATGFLEDSSGSGPWTAVISMLSDTTMFSVGQEISATGVGTANLGAGGVHIITAVGVDSITYVSTGGTAPVGGDLTDILIINQTVQVNPVLNTWPEGYVYATLREYYIKRHNDTDAGIYDARYKDAWNVVEDQNNLGKWSGGHTRLTSVWQPRQYRQYNIK